MSIVCKCGQKLNVGRHECSFGEVVEVSMSTKPKKSCIKDTTYDSNCIGCEAVNDEKEECKCWLTKETGKMPEVDENGMCKHGAKVSYSEGYGVSLPTEERSWEESFRAKYGHFFISIDGNPYEYESSDIEKDIRKIEHSTRLSEREKVLNEVIALTEYTD
jgi:hypothetical protein